jgi:predicted metalloprotease
MRWKGSRKSTNVEDRRGQSVGSGGGTGSGLLSFIPMLVRTKTGRIMLLVGVVVFFGSRMMGIDLLPLLLGGGGSTVNTQPHELSAATAIGDDRL